MGDRVVRVLPDVAAIDKVFDYVVPDSLPGAQLVQVGSEVRISLHGRRVGAWVLAVDVEPTPGVTIQPIAKIRGLGPPATVVELCSWVAWRWGGRSAQVLRFATPPHPIRALPPAGHDCAVPPSAEGDALATLVVGALNISAPTVLVTPPGTDRFAMVVEVCRRADQHGAIIVTPSAAMAESLHRRLRRLGVATALLPQDWAMAAAGGYVVIGARAAVFAPIPTPAAIVVIDEHDESHQDQRTPTWHARDVAVERARRSGIPCILTSPCPTLEALAVVEGRVLTPTRTAERRGWAITEVIDRSQEEPGRQGLIAPGLVHHLRADGRVVCVLNRIGRARLLVCVTCNEVAGCERCGAAVAQPTTDAVLVCPRCAMERPVVCVKCGGARLKAVRMGTARAREELEAIAGRPVGEVTATTAELPGTEVLVGTEAVLHRVDRADVVAFLDLDAELLAPRHRAAEQTMALLARASRLVAGRSGRVVLQTRVPEHEVVQAALLGDPSRLVPAEQARRAVLRFSPAAAVAVISGPSCDAWAQRLRLMAPAVELAGGPGGPWLVRCGDHEVLADVLAGVDADRPPGRVRVEVDPLRI